MVYETIHHLIKRYVPQRAKQWAKSRQFIFPDYPKNFIGQKNGSLKNQKRIHSQLFPSPKPHAWLDQPNAQQEIHKNLAAGKITPVEAEACLYFSKFGYWIERQAIPQGEVDTAISDLSAGRKEGRFASESGDRRCFNPHLASPSIYSLLKNPKLLARIKLFTGQEPIPFQSIGSEWGSGQLEHSDAIHMTTYPLGYMTAAWLACEDIHPDSGPLVYYPGSHRLPYYLCSEVGISQEAFAREGYTLYTKIYEPFIQNLIREQSLKPEYFIAQKGDVLFWHHNLLHGGSQIKQPSYTRKSLVFHYFAKGALCYHELNGNRAYLPSLDPFTEARF